MELKGDFVTRASLSNHKPLPRWLKYDPKTYTFSGIAMPSNEGVYPIKIYISDNHGHLGYIEFKLKNQFSDGHCNCLQIIDEEIEDQRS